MTHCPRARGAYIVGMNNLIITIDLTGYQPLGCLLPGGDLMFAQAQGPVVRVRLGEQAFFLLDSLLVRADSYGVERVYQAGLLLLELAARFPALARAGLDEAWRKAFKHDLERMYEVWCGEEAERHGADVDRRLESSREARAREAVGRFLQLVQAAQLRDWFSTVSGDRQTLTGLLAALREINGKVQRQAIREPLLRVGVTEDFLRELADLGRALHEERGARVAAQADALVDTAPLRAAKGLVVGEISRVSSVARAELPGSQWEAFQVTRLLDLPRPAAGRAEPQPPAPTPTPAPAPSPAFSAAPWSTPASAAPTASASAPAVVALPTGPALAAGATLPAASSAGAAASAAAGAPASTTTAAPKAAPLPAPGTLIATLPGNGGPAVHGFLQADGTVRWVPETTATTSAPEAPAPAATTKPKSKSAATSAAAPRRRTRR